MMVTIIVEMVGSRIIGAAWCHASHTLLESGRPLDAELTSTEQNIQRLIRRRRKETNAAVASMRSALGATDTVHST